MITEHVIVSAVMGFITVFGLFGAWVASNFIDKIMEEAEEDRRGRFLRPLGLPDHHS